MAQIQLEQQLINVTINLAGVGAGSASFGVVMYASPEVTPSTGLSITYTAGTFSTATAADVLAGNITQHVADDVRAMFSQSPRPASVKVGHVTFATLAVDLTALLAETTFYGLVLDVDGLSVANKITYISAAAAWAEAQTVIHCAQSHDPSTYTSGTSDVAYVEKALARERTIIFQSQLDSATALLDQPLAACALARFLAWDPDVRSAPFRASLAGVTSLATTPVYQVDVMSVTGFNPGTATIEWTWDGTAESYATQAGDTDVNKTALNVAAKILLLHGPAGTTDQSIATATVAASPSGDITITAAVPGAGWTLVQGTGNTVAHQTPNAAVRDITAAELAYIQGKNCNVVLPYGGASAFIDEGVNCNGRAPHEIVSKDWLSARITEDLSATAVDLANRGLKFGLNAKGEALVQGIVNGRLGQGVQAGHFDSFTPCETSIDTVNKKINFTATATVQGDAREFAGIIDFV